MRMGKKIAIEICTKIKRTKKRKQLNTGKVRQYA